MTSRARKAVLCGLCSFSIWSCSSDDELEEIAFQSTSTPVSLDVVLGAECTPLVDSVRASAEVELPESDDGTCAAYAGEATANGTPLAPLSTAGVTTTLSTEWESDGCGGDYVQKSRRSCRREASFAGGVPADAGAFDARFAFLTKERFVRGTIGEGPRITLADARLRPAGTAELTIDGPLPASIAVYLVVRGQGQELQRTLLASGPPTATTRVKLPTILGTAQGSLELQVCFDRPAEVTACDADACTLRAHDAARFDVALP